jgi:hypothetical protein
MYAADQARQMIYNMVQRQASLLAFVEAYRVLGLIFLAVIPFVFLMKKTRVGKTGAPTELAH